MTEETKIKIQTQTKGQFMKPYNDKVDNDDAIAQNMRARGASEEEINDYLRMINED